jgi:hypothetical protein
MCAAVWAFTAFAMLFYNGTVWRFEPPPNIVTSNHYVSSVITVNPTTAFVSFGVIEQPFAGALWRLNYDNAGVLQASSTTPQATPDSTYLQDFALDPNSGDVLVSDHQGWRGKYSYTADDWAIVNLGLDNYTNLPYLHILPAGSSCPCGTVGDALYPCSVLTKGPTFNDTARNVC